MSTLNIFYFFIVLSAMKLFADHVVPDEEKVQMADVLSKIDMLLRQQFNLEKEHGNNGPLSGDMNLSLTLAERVLAFLTEEMPENVKEDQKKRVFPNTWNGWQLPIGYVFDGTHSDSEKEVIREGMRWWTDATCVEFLELEAKDKRLDSVRHFYITKGSKCDSKIGNAGLQQQVSLGEGCLKPGIVAHELGHVLGMVHEHMRFDRDNYVKINAANVAGSLSSFAKVPEDFNVDYGTGYDFSSIMQYDSLAFSSNYTGRARTIEPLDVLKLTSMGEATRLSFNDAKRINYHYNCIAKKCTNVTLSKPCLNGGYQDPLNCVNCRCPYGIGGDFCELVAGHWAGSVKCGGIIDLAPCTSAVITSPSFPERFPAETDCSWHIRTTAQGLIVGQLGQPDLSCTSGDTCLDYFEIRSNFSELDRSGNRFCTCGKSAGRVGIIDGSEAHIYFHSAPAKFKPNGINGRGFWLSVFATCGNTKASKFTSECIITDSGYDYAGLNFMETVSGAKCKPWAGQAKHSSISFPDKSLLDTGKACRNPTSASYPWCYVDENYTSTERCVHIPKCDSFTHTPPTDSSQSTVVPPAHKPRPIPIAVSRLKKHPVRRHAPSQDHNHNGIMMDKSEMMMKMMMMMGGHCAHHHHHHNHGGNR